MPIKEMRLTKMQQALDYYDYVTDAASALGIRPETLWRVIKRENLIVSSSKKDLENLEGGALDTEAPPSR